MRTLRMGDHTIVEVIKETAKTIQYKEITGYDYDIKRAAKKYFQLDSIEPLTKENCKKANLILNIKNPEWGVKPFTYDGCSWYIRWCFIICDSWCNTVGLG